MFEVSENVVKNLKKEYIFTCKKCKGKGSILVKKEEGFFYKECDCVSRFQEVYKQIAANIPKKYRNISLEIVDQEFKKRNVNGLTKIIKYTNKFSESLDKGIGLHIYGPDGVGKTFWGTSILKKALKEGFTAHFLYIEDLVTLIFQARKDTVTYNKLKTYLTSVDFLLVDDIDKLDPDCSTTILFLLTSIFKARYHEEKPLITTSNVAKSTFTGVFPSLSAIFNEQLLSVFLDGSHRPKILDSLEKEFFDE